MIALLGGLAADVTVLQLEVSSILFGLAAFCAALGTGMWLTARALIGYLSTKDAIVHSDREVALQKFEEMQRAFTGIVARHDEDSRAVNASLIGLIKDAVGVMIEMKAAMVVLGDRIGRIESRPVKEQ